MTRFLPGILGDSECASFNSETERLFAYHHATKHSYRSVRSNARFLDWHNQPDPFRRYEDAPLIELQREPGFPEAGTFATMAALGPGMGAGGNGPSDLAGRIHLDASWLSRLLWHSMAISA